MGFFSGLAEAMRHNAFTAQPYDSLFPWFQSTDGTTVSFIATLLVFITMFAWYVPWIWNHGMRWDPDGWMEEERSPALFILIQLGVGSIITIVLWLINYIFLVIIAIVVIHGLLEFIFTPNKTWKRYYNFIDIYSLEPNERRRTDNRDVKIAARKKSKKQKKKAKKKAKKYPAHSEFDMDVADKKAELELANKI